MSFFKQIIVLILLTLVTSQVFAYQSGLSEFGFNGIELNESSKKSCENISIDISKLNEEGSGILSLNANFDGISSDNSYISVKISQDSPIIIWPEYFSCKNTCWARVFLPKLATEKIDLELCVNTGGMTQKAALLKSSFIGLYDTPVLSIQNIAPEQILLGEKAKMKIILENTGSKDTNFFVQFVSKDIRSFIEITSFDIVEGSSSATGRILAGQSKEFEFAIKPAKVSSYNLPYSVVKFENIFGEEQILTSEHPQLNVLNPEQISVSLISTEVEGKLKLTLLIKNNWNEKFDGNFIISPTDLIVSSSQELNLSAFGEKEVVLLTDKLTPGEYSFSSKISDKNNSYYSNTISYSVKKDDISFAVLFALLAIIVAVGIFYVITYIKQKRK